MLNSFITIPYILIFFFPEKTCSVLDTSILCISRVSAIISQVMKLIYACDNFQPYRRAGAMPRLRQAHRPADEAERQEYEERLKEPREI